MTLHLIQSALRARPGMASDAWVANETKRGENVTLAREYANGDHRAKMTAEMRAMLRIGSEGDLDQFNDNYCPIIIDTMVDRLRVNGFSAQETSEALEVWIDDLLQFNRFDALQTTQHDATIRDGNSYLLVDIDPETGKVRWTHEPAYDGSDGMLVVYASRSDKRPLLAIKVWQITTTNIADTVRINVYYANRIERFISRDGSALSVLVPELDGEEPISFWTENGTENGRPLGVPVFHFRNRGAGYDSYGLSEIGNVIPLQDALNRTLHSMVATSELTGFPIRYAVGTDFPSALTPGTAISVNAKTASGAQAVPSEGFVNWLSAVRFGAIEQGEIIPFVEQARWLREEIFRITSTPDDNVSMAASGEARKQTEIKLIGKLERFQTLNGNVWEDAVKFSARLQNVFSSGAPPIESLSAEWDSVELRNDSETISSALNQFRAGVIDQETYLEMVAPIYGWDNAKIQQIIERTQEAAGQGVALTQSTVSGMLERLNNAGLGEGGGAVAQLPAEVNATNGAVPATSG